MAATLPARRVRAGRDATAPVRPLARRAPRSPQQRQRRTVRPAPGASRTTGDRGQNRGDSTPLRRAQLRLVARPRLAINAALLLVMVVVALMLTAVVLHTRLAERQVEIDRVQAAVIDARARFDVLRQHRAELRAPNRLGAAAADLGMVQAGAADFLAVDPATVAQVLVAEGRAGETLTTSDEFAALEQIRRIKATAD